MCAKAIMKSGAVILLLNATSEMMLFSKLQRMTNMIWNGPSVLFPVPPLRVCLFVVKFGTFDMAEPYRPEYEIPESNPYGQQPFV